MENNEKELSLEESREIVKGLRKVAEEHFLNCWKKATCEKCKKKAPDIVPIPDDWHIYDMLYGAWNFYCDSCWNQFLKLKHKRHKEVVYWFTGHWSEPDWQYLNEQCGGEDCEEDSDGK